MKKLLVISFLSVCTLSFYAQDITGDWNGSLKVQNMNLRLVFHVSKSLDGYTSTMDSPDQGAKGIPMSSTRFENGTFTIEMTEAKIQYSGSVNQSGDIDGTFTQAGQSFPMILSRKVIEKAEIKRPQNPVKPYPYYSEEVTFVNTKDHVTLAGTLTLPAKEGQFPVVVLVTGSGPQNRDEELMGHKPFLVLSDYLTRNGIGVLRYDDRGVGSSTGNFSTATTSDFASDAEAAVQFLQTKKNVDHQKIGMIGHSEGGLIAPMVAAKSANLSFIVLMAGPGVSGGDILLLQQKLLGRVSGLNEEDLDKVKNANYLIYKLICHSKDSKSLQAELKSYLTAKQNELPKQVLPPATNNSEAIDKLVDMLTTPWLSNFICYNPIPVLEKVKCPVLAINGSKDMQVSAEVNLSAISNALKKAGNKLSTTKELPNLNHLFQECKTGAPSEYSQIDQTISPLAMETMLNWINAIIK